MHYLSGKTYDAIVQEVISIYQDYVLTSLPIDVKKLAADMRIRLKPYSALPKEVRESLLQGKDTKDGFHTCDVSKGYPVYTIWYNDLKVEERWRHTIAHEIGHIVLRHGSRTGELQEAEADYFAKQLLAPSCLVILTKSFDLEAIQKRFGISFESAIYTLKSTRQRREKYGEVFMEYENNFIEWARGWLNDG